MKKGEKAWVLCEVAGDSPCGAVLMKGPQGTPFWANERDCKPVEHEAFQLRKPNAIFTMQGHVRKGTYGVAKYNGNLWCFESVDGKFKRWCEGQHIELLDEENIELPVKQSPKDDEHCIGNVCDMFEPTGIACPHDSCDIETGVRNPVVQQSMTVEEQPPSDSDYRDATPEDVERFMRGEKIEARFRDFDYQDWNRSKGYRNRKQFLAGVELRNGKYRWVDDDNRSWMICQVYDPKKPQPEQASPIEHLPGWFEKGFWDVGAMSDATVADVLNNQPKSGLDLLCDQDILQAGDLFDSTRDGKFHRCNFTVGMTVREAVLRGHQQREGWTFYRPKVKA
jgi:hypothetical protein